MKKQLLAVDRTVKHTQPSRPSSLRLAMCACIVESSSVRQTSVSERWHVTITTMEEPLWELSQHYLEANNVNPSSDDVFKRKKTRQGKKTSVH